MYFYFFLIKFYNLFLFKLSYFIIPKIAAINNITMYINLSFTPLQLQNTRFRGKLTVVLLYFFTLFLQSRFEVK